MERKVITEEMKQALLAPLPYDERYAVTKDGRVFSRCRKPYYYELKQSNDSDGYKIVTIHRKTVKVHRLIAEMFIPNPYNLPCINHIDENKTNNNVSNLEWCDVKYNNNYGTHQKKSAYTRLNHTNISKKVLCVEDNIIYPSIREAGRVNKISYVAISNCCRGISNTSNNKHWKYVE